MLHNGIFRALKVDRFQAKTVSLKPLAQKNIMKIVPKQFLECNLVCNYHEIDPQTIERHVIHM